MMFVSSTFSQTDYKKGTVNKDGFCTIYISDYKTSSSGSSAYETRYGLLNVKKNKIVLPIIYKNIFNTYEEGLYIVSDTLDNKGLYATKNQKFLIQPIYNKIESFSDDVAIVQKKIKGKYAYSSDYRYGAIDVSGKLILVDTFEYLGKYKDGLMNFRVDKKSGYLNKQGKVIIPPTYQNSSDFTNGLAPVRYDDYANYGYINTENKFIVEPKYVFAENFYNGYANVYYERKYFGKNGNTKINRLTVIDTKGKEIAEPIYESISLRKDGGIFVVTKDGKEGLIDSTGKELLKTDNKDIGEFYQGLAIVQKTEGVFGLINNKGKFLLQPEYSFISSIYSSEDNFSAKKDNKYTVYDKKINVIIAADTAKRIIHGKKYIASVFDNSVKIFDIKGKYLKTIVQENIGFFGAGFYSNEDSIRINSEKTISLFNLKNNTKINLDIDEVSDFNSDGIFIGKKSNRWSFYDYTSKKLFPPSFENVVNFTEGICGLQESTYSTPYLADKALTKIATLTTVFYGPYSEGLAMSKSQYGSTIYYLNKEGKTQFSIPGKDGFPCKDGRIKIKNNSDKFLYVDINGKPINNSTYDDLGDFYNGLAGFMNNKKGGYIDTAGIVVIPAQYDEVSNFSNGTAIVKVGNDFFQINKVARPITSNKYIAASDPSKGFFPVKKTSGFGLIDEKGNTIIDYKYQEVAAMNEDRAWAKKNNKCGLLDKSGVEIAPFIYDACTNFDNGYCTVTKNGKSGVMDKSGKLVLPMEYTHIGKVFNNNIIIVKPYYSTSYSIK